MADRTASSTQPATPRSVQGGRPARRLSNLLRRYSFSQLSQSQPETAPTSVRSGQSSGSHLLSTSAGSANTGSGRLISPLRAAASALSTRAQSFDLGSSQTHEGRSRTTPSPIPSRESADARPLRSSRVRKVRLAPYIDATRTLAFFPADLDLVEGGARVQIGRFSDRNVSAARTSQSGPATALGERTNDPNHSVTMYEAGSMRQPVMVGENKTCVAFQSKVVSRLHAEIWCGEDGKIYLRDTKSSSGTFVNRLRLSPPGVLSHSYEIKDGDIVQFGIDYQGGSEDLFRAVKVRVEIDRDSSIRPTAYGQNMLQQLRGAQKDTAAKKATVLEKEQLMDECCICLLKMRVCQALFIAPCSHMFHYKCIRPILSLHYPGFSCPLCRTFADLEADLEDDTDEEPETAETPAYPKAVVAGNDQGQRAQEPLGQVRSEQVATSSQQGDPSSMSPCDLSDASDAVATFSTPLLPAAEFDSSPMARSDVQVAVNPGSQYIPTGVTPPGETLPSSSAPDIPPSFRAPASAPPLFWRSRAMSS